VWSECEDSIIGGDLTAALAYVTPAGGTVVTPVAPIGLRDRAAGTVGFTTSLGFGRKLDRIKQNPRVALAYHAREHGFASERDFVLVQGTASYDSNPDVRVLEERIQPASERFLGRPRLGPFWRRWLSAYYEDRVLVTVDVERVLSWSDPSCAGAAHVSGTAQTSTGAAGAELASQTPPRNGTAPRVDAVRERKRVARLPHVLVGYTDAEGFPLVAPVSVGQASDSGIALTGPLPAGERRAGLLAHRYEAQLIGLETRQHTGWLSDGNYAPHTAGGFRAPANKTALLLANGYIARRGLKQARAAGRT
jgi:hypothetical protein